VIAPDALARQQSRIESLHLEAQKLEAEVRLKAAREDSVRLGLRRWCVDGCGRVVGLNSKTGACTACQTRKCMARKRRGAALRLVKEG
jgi:hypothetical protein